VLVLDGHIDGDGRPDGDGAKPSRKRRN